MYNHTYEHTVTEGWWLLKTCHDGLLTKSESRYNSYEQCQVYKSALSGRFLNQLHLLLFRKLHTFFSFDPKHAATHVRHMRYQRVKTR